MIIAREKKKNNIAEYILYMWQIEDMIRAYKFDLEEIDKQIIQAFNESDDVKEEMREWYKDLISQMKNQGLEESGHLQFLNDYVNQLEELHQQLIHSPEELKYLELYNWALPNIKSLRQKSENARSGDIEICLKGLYGLLLMRLKKQQVTEETKGAMGTFSNMMALLAQKYNETHKNN